MDPLLALGLGALFVAFMLAISAFDLLKSPSRAAVARSLAAVGAVQTEPTDLRERELNRPFNDRVLDPVIRNFVVLGRSLTPDERVQHIRRRLDLAGNPANWDADRVLGVKGLGLVCGALLGLVLPSLISAGPLIVLIGTGVGVFAGWFGPSMWLYQVAYNRSELVRRQLPDALDVLTISMEAGLAFDAALAQVANKTTGPLAAEFFRVLQEMQIGTGRIVALRALAERTDVTELSSFIGAMVQADAFGIPISAVLRVQAKELRVKRSQRAEELAQKVPVKITFPLIVCILPCLFIVVMGPAALTIMNNFSGWRK